MNSSLYKMIFGQNAKLDTSISINSDSYYVGTYHYIESLDKYVLYIIEGGGICGPTSYDNKITKANNDIYVIVFFFIASL